MVDQAIERGVPVAVGDEPAALPVPQLEVGAHRRREPRRADGRVLLQLAVRAGAVERDVGQRRDPDVPFGGQLREVGVGDHRHGAVAVALEGEVEPDAHDPHVLVCVEQAAQHVAQAELAQVVDVLVPGDPPDRDAVVSAPLGARERVRHVVLDDLDRRRAACAKALCEVRAGGRDEVRQLDRRRQLRRLVLGAQPAPPDGAARVRRHVGEVVVVVPHECAAGGRQRLRRPHDGGRVEPVHEQHVGAVRQRVGARALAVAQHEHLVPALPERLRRLEAAMARVDVPRIPPRDDSHPVDQYERRCVKKQLDRATRARPPGAPDLPISSRRRDPRRSGF